jgi:hypothetical protein
MCDVQHARGREDALAQKSELSGRGGEPGQWRSLLTHPGRSRRRIRELCDFFSRLSSDNSIPREKKVYRADDCAAPLQVVYVDVGQVVTVTDVW